GRRLPPVGWRARVRMGAGRLVRLLGASLGAPGEFAGHDQSSDERSGENHSHGLPLTIPNPKYDGGIRDVYGRRTYSGPEAQFRVRRSSELQSCASRLTAVPTRLSGVEAPDVNPIDRFPAGS